MIIFKELSKNFKEREKWAKFLLIREFQTSPATPHPDPHMLSIGSKHDPTSGGLQDES